MREYLIIQKVTHANLRIIIIIMKFMILIDIS